MIVLIGIYKITNLLNNKCYIGQSINIEKRWYEHRYKAFAYNDISFNSPLHLSFRKNGLENFSFEVLEECLNEELDIKEKFYIEKFKSIVPNGYNISSGGQATRGEPKNCLDCGKSLNRQNKTGLCFDCYRSSRKVDLPEKLELAKLIKEKGFAGAGRLFNVSPTCIRRKCKEYNIPNTIKEVIAWYNKQVGIVEEKKKEKKLKNFGRKVAQIDLKTNEIVNIFESANAAARSLEKIKGNHITEVCNGKSKQAYGFKWKYID